MKGFVSRATEAEDRTPLPYIAVEDHRALTGRHVTIADETRYLTHWVTGDNAVSLGEMV